jgi:hypothetical protein
MIVTLMEVEVNRSRVITNQLQSADFRLKKDLYLYQFNQILGCFFTMERLKC